MALTVDAANESVLSLAKLDLTKRSDDPRLFIYEPLPLPTKSRDDSSTEGNWAIHRTIIAYATSIGPALWKFDSLSASG